jgi:serine/threonine protein kinase
VPTGYIAASGFVAGVALLILVVVLAIKFRKARKRDYVLLKNKEHEVRELTNTWNIDSREIKLRKRIDTDSPGGYGEVYQADYREMTVAVKKLQGIHQHLQRLELEFEREIEVMRTIRHPNIVLFLGGGRYHDDSCPFLVVEFMSRGSLTTVLENKEITLDKGLKMRFAVEAAKGMRFLHSLRPPRVHRDLKSANLLVSGKWVVKVADFGAARLVRDEGINYSSVRGTTPMDATVPLLHADYQLSSAVGTTRWCAPEIMCGSGYGTPADVYR